jgi:type IV pilus assembly protein PilC
MAKFDYRAKDKEGRISKGIVESRDEKQAVRILHERNLIVISLEPVAKGLFSEARKGIFARVGIADLVKFTRQLSTMFSAGLPLTDALTILKTQASPQMSVIVEAVLRDVEGGSSLADAMGRHPQVFDEIYVALIRSGEAAGVLDKVLTRLADNLEKRQEFLSRVKGAMVYPMIVVAGMGVVAGIMIVFVIPRLMVLYEEFETELPITTKLLLAFSKMLTSYWWLSLILVIGGGLALRAFINTPFGRRRYDALLFRLPIFGNLRHQMMLTEFTRTFGLLAGAGILVVDAINILKGSMNSPIYREALVEASSQVEKGLPLAAALARTEVFPVILPQMIAVGEETGKLEEVFNKVSAYFEQEADAAVRTLTTALEPLIMVLLGIGVGFLIISVIMPIYNLTSQF